MIDDGETDWKVICIATDDVLAPKLNDIDDVERLMPGTISVMREWLRNYKVLDGTNPDPVPTPNPPPNPTPTPNPNSPPPSNPYPYPYP